MNMNKVIKIFNEYLNTGKLTNEVIKATEWLDKIEKEGSSIPEEVDKLWLNIEVVEQTLTTED